jgi:hypothetical protein
MVSVSMVVRFLRVRSQDRRRRRPGPGADAAIKWWALAPARPNREHTRGRILTDDWNWLDGLGAPLDADFVAGVLQNMPQQARPEPIGRGARLADAKLLA